jgi:DNA polymerase
LVDAFTKGEDVYKIMASSIYGKPVDKITESERFVGKTTILGAGYGMGADKFQTQLKTFNVYTELSECERIIKVYRETYPKIPTLWQEGQEAIKALLSGTTSPLGKEGVVLVNALGIRLPNGLYIKYPNLRTVVGVKGRTEYVYDQRKGRATIPNRIYGGKVVENLCQALARIIIGEQMLMISRRQKVVMTVHDAVGSIVPDADADTGRAFVEQCMRIQPKWADGLPLNCESKMGKSYGG